MRIKCAAMRVVIAILSLLSIASASRHIVSRRLYFPEDDVIREHPDARGSQLEEPVLGLVEVEVGGKRIVGQTNQHAHSFFSIPFAKPPVGQLRFMPPQPTTLPDVFNASQPNDVRCVQRMRKSEHTTVSEDCLVLTVHVPSRLALSSSSSSSLLPVMFWIFGGAYFHGSGNTPLYDARYLAESTDTVIVTSNYRLSALGFLVYEEDGVKFDGNQGFQDQQLALQWVHDNIKSFGGDPNQVTLFGESAGAQSVMFHLLSPVSDPLFRRGIMQSNVGAMFYPTRDQALQITDDVIGLLRCDDSLTDLECLRTTDADDLVHTTGRLAISSLLGGNFFDTFEPFKLTVGNGEFPDQPLRLFEQGRWQTDKELIIGTNIDELAFANAFLINRTMGKTMFERMNNFLLGPELGPQVAQEYKKLAKPALRPDYTEAFSQEITDMVFACPDRLLTRFASQTSTTATSSVHLYVNEQSMCEDPSKMCGWGIHGSELVYVFNTGHFFGKEFSDYEQLISSMFSDYWGSFAHTGKPTSSRFAAWPAYVKDESNRWPNLRIKAPNSEVETNYRKDLCDFWDSLDYYLNLTETTSAATPGKPIGTTTASKVPEKGLHGSVDGSMTDDSDDNGSSKLLIHSSSFLVVCVSFLFAKLLE